MMPYHYATGTTNGTRLRCRGGGISVLVLFWFFSVILHAVKEGSNTKRNNQQKQLSLTDQVIQTYEARKYEAQCVGQGYVYQLY